MGGLRDLTDLSVPRQARSIRVMASDDDLRRLLATEEDPPEPEDPVSF